MKKTVKNGSGPFYIGSKSLIYAEKPKKSRRGPRAFLSGARAMFLTNIH
jgi:hypothetical protein